VKVNGVTGTVTNLGSGNYKINGPIVTKSGSYSAGIALYAASLNSIGVNYIDFVVNPGSPNGPNCTIAAYDSKVNYKEFTAGSSFYMMITLYDFYGNLANLQTYTVGYSYTPAAGSSTSGTATASSTTVGLYFFTLSATVAGSLSLSATVTVSSTVQDVANSPIPVLVEAGAFSIASSQVSGLTTTTAGTSQILTIIAKDSYGNLRSGASADVFNISAFYTSNNGIKNQGTSSWTQTGGSAYYTITYEATKSGTYTMKVQVKTSSTDGLSYLTFRTLSITVNPSSIVPTNSLISGSGLTGGSQGAAVELIVQARDKYNNVITAAGDGLFLTSIGQVSGTSLSYYIGSYCVPYSKTCGLTTVSFYKKFLSLDDSTSFSSSSSSTSNLTKTELSFYTNGFWRLYYVVPSTTTTNGSFPISIYYANNTERSSSSENASVTIAREDTVLATSFNGTAYLTSTTATANDPWAAVGGAVGGGVFACAVAYGAWRLSRYRPKYHSEKARAEEAENILQEIQDEAYLPGARDYMAVGAATVTKNPLHEVYNQHMSEMNELGNLANPTRELQVAGKTGRSRLDE